ncbi:MAG: DUF1365 family protein [Hyphomicrobiaceae bacterium]
MSLRSALYVGSVSHHRMTPKRHALRHRVYWLLLDLAELPTLNAKLNLFSHNGMNLTSFYDRDHGDGTSVMLLDQARAHLREAGIEGAGVSVQLLCMPRVAGYDFNPLSVYFCSDAQGDLVAIIYEVSNTFGGRHSYVIPTPKTATAYQDRDTIRQDCDKAFYVSPFMDLDMNYRFRTRAPADKVSVSVQARKDGRAVINTSLLGHRRDLNDLNLLRLAATHPVLPLNVTGAIYWHALKLWWRGFAINRETPSKTTTVTIVRPNQ